MQDIYATLRIHKAWVYAGVILALLVLLVVFPADTAAAATPGTGGLGLKFPASGTSYNSPADWAAGASQIDNISDATRYLAWNRWYSSNALGSPEASLTNMGASVAAGITVFARMMLIAASFLMYVVGQFMTLVLGFDLLGQTANSIDFIFARLGSSILGNTNNDFRLQGIVVAVVAIIGLAVYVFYLWARRGQRAAMNTLAMGISALALLGIMSTQASSNHDMWKDAPTIGSERTGDYAVMSPGWFIEKGGELGVDVSTFATRIVSSLSSVLTDAGSTSALTGECASYVDAMHGIYLGNGNNFSAIPVQYDNLALALYFETYRMASLGENGGSEGSWCRIAEVAAGSPAAEQVMLSRKAGLYKEVGGLDWNGRREGGGLVNADGSWSGAASSAAAQSLFGPNFANSTSFSKITAYWAACRWTPGGGVTVNPDWDGVISARKLDDSFWDSISGALGYLWEDITGEPKVDQAACEKPVTSLDDGTGKAFFPLDPEKADWVAQAGIGFDRSKKQGEEFAFQERSVGISGLFSIRIAGAAPLFETKVAAGNSNALDYYMISQGMFSSWTLALSIIALVLTIMMAKYVLPIIIGGILAQSMGIIAWIFLVFVLLLMIVPFKRTLDLGKTTALTIFWSFISAAVFVTIIGFILVMFNLFSTLFYTPTANMTVRIIQLSLAAVLSFQITKVMLKKLINYDMSSFKSAVMSAGVMSGRAILQQSGHSVPPIFARPQNGGGFGQNAGTQSASPFKKTSDMVKDRFSGLREDGMNSLLDKQKQRANDAKSEHERNKSKREDDRTGKNSPSSQPQGGPGKGGAPGTPASAAFVPGGKNLPNQKQFGGADDLVKSFTGKENALGEQVERYNGGFQNDNTIKMDKGQAQALTNGPTSGAGMPDDKNPGKRLSADEVSKAMTVYGAGGDLARYSTGMGADVSPLDRTFTMADRYNGARPLTPEEIARMSPEDRKAYQERRLDQISPTNDFMGRRWYSVSPNGTTTEERQGMVLDPFSGMLVPEGLVTAGSNIATQSEVTRGGHQFAGMSRQQGTETWEPRTSVKKEQGFVPLSTMERPQNVSEQLWNSAEDLQNWMSSENIDTDSPIATATWPRERRQQYEYVANNIEGLYSEMGIELPTISNEELAETGIGLGASPSDKPLPRHQDVKDRLASELAGIQGRVRDVNIEALGSMATSQIDNARRVADEQIAETYRAADAFMRQSEDAGSAQIDLIRQTSGALIDRVQSVAPWLIEEWANNYGGPADLLRAVRDGEVTEDELYANLILPSEQNVAPSDGAVADMIRRISDARAEHVAQVENRRRETLAQVENHILDLQEQVRAQEEEAMDVVLQGLESSADDAARTAAQEIRFAAQETVERQGLVSSIREWFRGFNAKG